MFCGVRERAMRRFGGTCRLYLKRCRASKFLLSISYFLIDLYIYYPNLKMEVVSLAEKASKFKLSYMTPHHRYQQSSRLQLFT